MWILGCDRWHGSHIAAGGESCISADGGMLLIPLRPPSEQLVTRVAESAGVSGNGMVRLVSKSYNERGPGSLRCCAPLAVTCRTSSHYSVRRRHGNMVEANECNSVTIDHGCDKRPQKERSTPNGRVSPGVDFREMIVPGPTWSYPGSSFGNGKPDGDSNLYPLACQAFDRESLGVSQAR